VQGYTQPWHTKVNDYQSWKKSSEHASRKSITFRMRFILFSCKGTREIYAFLKRCLHTKFCVFLRYPQDHKKARFYVVAHIKCTFSNTTQLHFKTNSTRRCHQHAMIMDFEIQFFSTLLLLLLTQERNIF
jgi:hypothetical protein